MTPSTASKAAYETWHGQYGVDEPSDTPWHRLVKSHLCEADLTGSRVLEIGCGRGGFACWLAAMPRGPREIFAADFSLTAVRKGREFAIARNREQIRWEVVDIEAIAHQSGSFDLVFSCETIEHVPHPRRAVEELSRVLRPGGRLFLTTPNYMGTMGLYRIYRRLCGRPFTEEGQPINNLMMLPRTRIMLGSAGLTVTAIDGVGHYLPVPGRPPVELPRLNNPRRLMRWFALHSLTIARKDSL